MDKAGKPGARLMAAKALERWRKTGSAGLAFPESADARDRALAGIIFWGVMQNRILLDYTIEKYCRRPAGKLEPRVLDILRLSVYQLLFLDRIPESAAVNEGVELCRRMGCERASGLVNAVLRRAAGERGKPIQVEAAGPMQVLSLRWSCPPWLTEAAAEAVGPGELEDFLKAQNERLPLFLQVNTRRTGASALMKSLRDAGLEVRGHPWLPDCLEAQSTGPLPALPQFREGLFYVQDPASKLAVLAAEPCPGQRILDACAAPGGKSFAAALLGQGAEILSCDISEKKVRLIREGAQRLGFQDIHPIIRDAKAFFPEWEAALDIVLADLPCSGLGVIRKKPDIRYKDPAAFDQLPKIQREMLDNLCRYVKPGGVLLYSTCTFRREENEETAAAFLAGHPDFTPEDFSLPGGIRSEEGHCRLMPHRNQTDGFFIAKLRRKD